MRLSNSLCLAMVASVVLYLVPPTAQASGTAADFARADGNNDGVIAPGEHEDYARSMFNQIDTDRDGNITAAELDAAQGSVSDRAGGSDAMNSAQKIRRFDNNGDGDVSWTEAADGARLRYRLMDNNHNGEVTPQEFAAG